MVNPTRHLVPYSRKPDLERAAFMHHEARLRVTREDNARYPGWFGFEDYDHAEKVRAAERRARIAEDTERAIDKAIAATVGRAEAQISAAIAAELEKQAGPIVEAAVVAELAKQTAPD